MDTQIVGPQNEQANEKLLILRPRNLGAFAHTIYQEDIIELQLLGIDLTNAREACEKKREYIRLALISGARIELGPHTARLEDVAVQGHASAPYTYKKLLIR